MQLMTTSPRHRRACPGDPLRGAQATDAQNQSGHDILLAAAAILALFASPAHARLDLSHASVERLDNGLTLIMLEDRTFPVVSVQMTYRTGAKDDPAGLLGLAHFFEHMAFRGSRNFPDTGLVSEIYAVGGEWHGYTWIDSTNYFATVPKEHLPLLLDIKADRMARLEIRKEDVEAERGAVLAEMNGYLNDADSSLFDALMAAHFLTHPYRNNTIGYETDINAISPLDLARFYLRHYAPPNAVLTIVGDFDHEEVRAAVERKLGKLRKLIVGSDPLTAELPRTGERRIRLALPSEEKLFKIAYPAPAASSDDFAAFLVLQALIGESAGANFNQNDWGTPVEAESPLAGVAQNISTWIIPTAEPYAFVVSGSATDGANEGKVESSIQKAFDKIARGEFDAAALAEAKVEVADALAFDVDTTEQAAHQLAYFAGIGAFERLLSLDADVQSVTAEQIASVVRRYLGANQRTIAWLEPGPAAQQSAAAPPPRIQERTGQSSSSTPLSPPIQFETDGGVSVLFQRSTLSPTVAVKALLLGRFECDACIIDEIAFGTTTVSATAANDDTGSAFAAVATATKAAKPTRDGMPSDDPLTRLEEVFAGYATLLPDEPGARATASRPKVLLLAVSGDVDAVAIKDAIAKSAPQSISDLDRQWGSATFTFPTDDVSIRIDKPKPQAAVGYVVAAPAKTTLPTELALYALSHGYEGRLGKEAISHRGLLYYIDARFRRWIPGVGVVTLAGGVDPHNVDAFRTLLRSELDRLVSDPLSDDEIAEAKRHLLGRKISAAQSNEELAEAMIRDFLAVGAPESVAAFKKRLDAVSVDNVRKAAAALAEGAIVTVRVKGVD